VPFVKVAGAGRVVAGNARLCLYKDIVATGTPVLSICKNELPSNPRGVDRCVKSFTGINKLEDPDRITAAKTLVIPQGIY
jgi:hypothetical protein